MSGHIFKNTNKILGSDAIHVRSQIISDIHKKYPELTIINIGSVGKKHLSEYHGDIDLAIYTDSFETLVSIINGVFPNL